MFIQLTNEQGYVLTLNINRIAYYMASQDVSRGINTYVTIDEEIGSLAVREKVSDINQILFDHGVLIS